ncbi:MAG: hypothetical protein ACI36Y_05875 [Coriobacteriales bacterium]
MQEHMGKKRKRELREALDLRAERDKHARRAALIMGAGILVCILYFILCAFNIGINFTNLLFTFIPTIALVAGLFFSGSDINKATKANDKFKRFCAERSISKQDLKDFEAMMG